MMESGLVKFVVTSNHDNLHQKAGTVFKVKNVLIIFVGIPLDKIVDLYGNAYTEKCCRCKKEYHRNVIVPNIGRNCDDPNCGGRLNKIGK